MSRSPFQLIKALYFWLQPLSSSSIQLSLSLSLSLSFSPSLSLSLSLPTPFNIEILSYMNNNAGYYGPPRQVGFIRLIVVKIKVSCVHEHVKFSPRYEHKSKAKTT